MNRNKMLENVFNTVAEGYETCGADYFSYFGRALADIAINKDSHCVLDIACGKGASLLPVIDRLKGSGKIVGVDFSKGMLDHLKATLWGNNTENVDLLECEAECLPLSDETFDTVLCGLSIGFFSDAHLSLLEMHRVLNRGGRVYISTWKERSEEGVIGLSLRKLFSEAKKEDRRINGNLSFGTVEGVKHHLETAGFRDVKTFCIEKTFYYASKDEWWMEQMHNATRVLFNRLAQKDPNLLLQFKDIAYDELEKYQDEKGIRFEAKVLVTEAKKR